MPAFDFGQSQSGKAPTGSREQMSAVLDLRGLDLTTPVDLLDNGHTPFSKNFRLYAQQADSRRVAVSSRKGPGFYTSPLLEVLEIDESGTTGADTVETGTIQNIRGIPFTADSSDVLTRVDLKVGNADQARGTLLIEVWSDSDGLPYRKLSVSSITSGDMAETPGWETARFIKAVQLTASDDYWLIVKTQDDSVGTFQLATSTDSISWTTNSSLSQLTEDEFGINFRVYTTPASVDKGSYRFNRDNGENVTVVIYGTTLYYIVDDELVEVLDGLDSDATEYRFTNGDNKLFFVNGYDELTAWNGVFEDDATNLITNSSFTTNTSGWTAGASDSIARDTGDFNSTPASLDITSASGARRVVADGITLEANHRYKITYWAKGDSATGTTQPVFNTSITGPGQPVNITSSWAEYVSYYTPSVAITEVAFQASSTDWHLDDVSVVDTGIEYIIDTELPIASDIVMHKDRLWVRSAADENKLHWSNAPGNPSSEAASNQWYYNWRSVDFIYVPRPHNGSPVTWMGPFQDSLIVTTQDMKYVISGYDPGSFTLRESTGSKGALSVRGVASDENNIFFVADDGLYSFNGSADTRISDPISPLFDGCANRRNITPVIWKGEVRFYLASSGSTSNDTCLIWNKSLGEWQYDTDTYINRALYYSDADDNEELVEFSSIVPAVYYGEQDYNSLGAPIDFEYRLKYDSMGLPGQKKRIKRFLPILQGVDSTYQITLAMDKDFEDSPKIKELMLTTNGALVGAFDLGDGTLLGGDKSFNPKRQSYSGYARYWQLRVIRNAVNNRVAFIGAQFTYKTKRL